jgi:hypothetical protein
VPSSLLFWLKVPCDILKYGVIAIKKAAVSGNYHFPGSLFFGGMELQPSHKLVNEFLKNQFDLSLVKKMSFIDVHTGLGLSTLI